MDDRPVPVPRSDASARDFWCRMRGSEECVAVSSDGSQRVFGQGGTGSSHHRPRHHRMVESAQVQPIPIPSE